MDVNGANHDSFTNVCDAAQVLYNAGQISGIDLTAWTSGWPCESNIPNAATISSADAREVITKFMIAFLDIYLGGQNKNNKLDWQILTPEYALTHTPAVQFFDSEKCHAACLPDHTYFSYRPYQVSSECDVAQKDPTGWFGLPAASSNAAPMLLAPAPMLRTPAQVGPFRPSWKHF
ncbi:MAG: hypothetical protein ABSE08_11370 [Syntrophobacteraceae bacterium]